MKIIIIGAGEVGYHISQKLSEENQDVILIDKDPEKIRRITENLDVQAIVGPPPAFTITANPSGAQREDHCVVLSLDQAGSKTPDTCW